jgi:MFS family permease
MSVALRFSPPLTIAAVIVLALLLWVPRNLAGMVIALSILLLVLAPMPSRSRPVVMAVIAGLATGIASVNLFAPGIFQEHLTREFGWTQPQYTLVIVIATIVTVISSLFIGRLFDRFGVRRFAIASILIFSAMLISLRWLTPNLWHFYLIFGLMPILGAGTSSIAYSRVIARWFDRRRGQAFGAALAGIGAGGAVLSPLSQYLIGEFGWRNAYVGLGLIGVVVALPLVLWALYDSPAECGLGRDGELLASAVPQSGTATPSKAAAVLTDVSLTGYSAAQSRGQLRFWHMLAAFVLMAFAIGGVMLQLVPILRARGVPANEAVAVVGALSIALIAGRAFAGLLMDRMFAPYVAAAIILFPIVGVSLLALGATGGAALFAGACVGLAAGAELDVIAVLITRYFGTAAYAENYGWQYAGWTLGSGTAPLLTAAMYESNGSHTQVLWLYVGLFAISAVLVARLGAYPVLPAPVTSRSAA